MKKFKILLCIMAILLVLQPLSAFAAQTSQPYASSIKIANNASPAPDTITVTDLNVGDLVKVYVDASTTLTIGTGTVASGTSTVVINIAQLGVLTGTVYVSVTSGANTESKRTSKNYAAEPSTSFLDPAQITITNNPAGTSDVVNIVNLNVGDLIKVYATATDTAWIGSGTVASAQSVINISIAQIGSVAGSLYVTVTTSPTSESIRTNKSYAAEALTSFLAPSDIFITNNVTGFSDSIIVRNLMPADIIKIYRSKIDTTVLATATVASGQSTATLTIAQLGTTEGSIYLTTTRGAFGESTRTAKYYLAESASTAPVNNVKVTNNDAGTADILTIDNLNPTDIIKIYTSKTATSPVSITSASKNLLPPVSTWNLHANAIATSAYVVTLNATATTQVSNIDIPVIPGQSYTGSVGSTNSSISLFEYKNGVYNGITKTLNSGALTITWALKSDTTTVRYELTNTGAGTFTFTNPMFEIGTITDPFEPQATATTKNLIPPFSQWTSKNLNTVTLSPYNLKLNATGASQSSYVRVKVSPLTPYTFSATHTGQISIASISSTGTILTTHFAATTAQSGTFTTNASAAYVDFTLTNGASGTFTFTNPQLEQASSASNFETMTTALVTATIKITQIGTTAGTIYVTTTTPGSLESRRIVRTFGAESPTAAVAVKSIKITNNKNGTNDNIAVYGLVTGDVVKVYLTKIINTTLGVAIVGSGSTVGTISLGELGTSAGSVYITVTTAGKTESIRVAKSYLAE